MTLLDDPTSLTLGYICRVVFLRAATHGKYPGDEADAEAAAEASAAALHQHLLVEFALTLFQGALRKGLVNPRAPGSPALLTPLLPLLVRGLRSRHSPSVVAALSCLCLLVQAQLPGLDKAAAGGCRGTWGELGASWGRPSAGHGVGGWGVGGARTTRLQLV